MLAVVPAAGPGCGDGDGPVLTGIDPPHGYSDQQTRIDFFGTALLPGFTLDLADKALATSAAHFDGYVGDGTIRARLRDFEWLDKGRVRATLDAGLPRRLEPFSVVLTDPRGRTATLAGSFYSLGSDQAVPLLELRQPRADRKLAPGAVFPVEIRAWDPAPGRLSMLQWQMFVRGQPADSNACGLAPAGETLCRFELRVPEQLAPGDLFELEVTAMDASALVNRSSARLSYTLQDAPVLTAVAPAEGSALGGNDLLVIGSHFIAGTRVFIGSQPLIPDGGTLINPQTISGRLPPLPREFSAESSVTVPVRVVATTGQAELREGFRYSPPPGIDQVVPAAAPAAGGTPIVVRGRNFGTDTRVFFGARLSLATPMVNPQLVSANELRGLAPAGLGTTRVWIADALRGSTVWSGSFTFTNAAGSRDETSTGNIEP